MGWGSERGGSALPHPTPAGGGCSVSCGSASELRWSQTACRAVVLWLVRRSREGPSAVTADGGSGSKT